MAKDPKKAKAAAAKDKRCETNDPDLCSCELCHPKGCYCMDCEITAYQAARSRKTPCPVCSGTDWICGSCEQLQEAYDDEDDSYPGYYD